MIILLKCRMRNIKVMCKSFTNTREKYKVCFFRIETDNLFQVPPETFFISIRQKKDFKD